MVDVGSTTDRDPLLDGHFHIFLQSLDLVKNPRHRPQYDATVEDYLAYQRAFGLAGGLLVQPSFLGSDNSFLLATLEKLVHEAPGSCFKGVASVSPGTSHAQLQRLDTAGVVGARFNLFQKSLPPFKEGAWRSLLERIDNLNWHVEVQIEGERLPQVLSHLTAACRRVVVDHFGRPAADNPTRCPGYKALISDQSERLWVKISAPYRVFPHLPRDEAASHAAELAEGYAASLGEHALVWGSDWPWTQYEEGMTWEQIMRWRYLWAERFGLQGLRTLVPQFGLVSRER